MNDTLQDYVNECYKTAQAKGWWEHPREVGTCIALMHSELSEALEEFRVCGASKINLFNYDGEKPVGFPIELADVLIRIFDFCGRYEINIQAAVDEKMTYNESRPYRHGNKHA